MDIEGNGIFVEMPGFDEIALNRNPRSLRQKGRFLNRLANEHVINNSVPSEEDRE